MDLRRDFMLPPDDEAFLNGYGCPWETIIAGQTRWVLLHEFWTRHDGYNVERTTAAIRIETGYPKTALDMVWFYPALTRKDGKPIGATQATETIDGKAFQRWSRHRTQANPWIVNEDSLASHIFLIEGWLLREFEMRGAA